MNRARFFPGFLVVLISVAGHAFAWELRSIGGRDYVTASEIATFYGLTDPATPGPNSHSFSGGGRSLVFTRDTRSIEINGIVHWLAFPVLEKDGALLVSRMDLGKTIEPAFRPEMVPDARPFTTVVLDAGHGGHDRGAASVFECEKNFTLDVARRVRDALRDSGLKVVMTRNSDVFVELAARAAIANRTPQAIFVSLHFNAADTNPDANGLEIYCVTPRGAPSTAYELVTVRDMIEESGNVSDLQSFVLANTIYKSLHTDLQMTDRGVKRARFAVLRLSRVPSVLVEGGFLTNVSDSRRIASKPWRDSYARAIARGIIAYRRYTSAPAQTMASPAPPAGPSLREAPKPSS